MISFDQVADEIAKHGRAGPTSRYDRNRSRDQRRRQVLGVRVPALCHRVAPKRASLFRRILRDRTAAMQLRIAAG